MIPGVMIDFLGRASVAVAGTRDAQLLPHIHFLAGWYVEENREILACLVAAGFTESLMESLEDNGHFAMTAEVIGPHETYQFKGSYVGSRPPAASDQPIHEACRGRFIRAIQKLHPGYYTDAVLLARIGPPVIAIRIRVNEIYVQTPGPAAGQRLYPPRA